jgi:hypothetical protein
MYKIPEQFDVSETDFDGFPLIANINLALRDCPHREATPWLLSISTPLSRPTPKGLPSRQEADALNGWEAAVEREIGVVPFVFVGRVTWNGNRELLYYLKEPESPVRRLQALIDSRSTRPFAFRCEKDEAWLKVAVYFA